MYSIHEKFRGGVYCALFSLLFITSPGMAAQAGLEGDWQTGEDNTVVRVSGEDGVYVGKLLSSDNPKAKVGTEILRDFKQVDGAWKGTLYAVKRDKMMDATITPAADVLNIKVSAGMISKKVSWTRVAD